MLGMAGKWIMARLEWDREFACVGPDGIMAAVAAAAGFGLDFGKKVYQTHGPIASIVTTDDGKRLVISLSIVVGGFVALPFAWACHAQPIKTALGIRPPRTWNWKITSLLLVFWNAVAVALLFGFAYYVQPD